MGPVGAFYSLLELLFIEAQWPWARRWHNSDRREAKKARAAPGLPR